MAIKTAVRWKPDTGRSSLEATVTNLDPSTNPPSGTVVMIAQAVAYDDTKVTLANYRAGDPATERDIVVLYEQTRQYDLGAAQPMTQNAVNIFLANELTAFRTWITPALPTLMKVAHAARTAAPVVVA